MNEMREILFRGKRVDFREKRADDEEWFEGKLLANNVIVPVNQNFKANVSRFYGYEVIPETVGQYTGLPDKNGRKIFEGDIIEAVYFHLGNEIHNKFVVNDIRTLSSFPWSSYKDFVIIGNIHDNPELLKESNENDE